MENTKDKLKKESYIQAIINILGKNAVPLDNFNTALCSQDFEEAAEEIFKLKI